MAEDADSHPHGAHSHAASWWIAISVPLLIYILSPPPLIWMFEHFGWEDPDWLRYVYTPVIFLYDQFEPVRNFYDGYGRLLGLKHL